MSNKRLVAIDQAQVEALREANTGSHWRAVLDDLADSYEDGITVEEAEAVADDLTDRMIPVQGLRGDAAEKLIRFAREEP